MRMIYVAACIAIATTISILALAKAPADEAASLLAPTGSLRVGVYPGSPLSIIQNSKSREIHGLSFDLGKELAKRLGISFKDIRYQTLSEVLAAAKAGYVDFTITNATPARAAELAFSQTLLSLESGYLVAPGSSLAVISDLNKPGIRVGVTKGSTSQQILPKILTNASVVPVVNLKMAIQMLTSRELDAFATNKSILFSMADQISGARVLGGRWGLEHIAVAIPKDRGGMEFIRRFVADVQSSGLLAEAEQRAGLRGVAKSE